MPLNGLTPIPLKQWIRGSIRIHFTHGHVATIDVDQDTADRIGRKVAKCEGPDYIENPGAHWLQLDTKSVILLEWTPDPELGWGAITPEERGLLAKAGHRHGILQSLADIWRDTGRDPAYCGDALAILLRAALKSSSMPKWESLARRLEGDAGVALLLDAESSLGHEGRDGGDGPDPNAGTTDRHGDEPTGAGAHTSGSDHQDGFNVGGDDEALFNDESRHPSDAVEGAIEHDPLDHDVPDQGPEEDDDSF